MTSRMNIKYKNDGKAEATIIGVNEKGEKRVLFKLTADVQVSGSLVTGNNADAIRDEVIRKVDVVLGQYMIQFATSFGDLQDALRDGTLEQKLSLSGSDVLRAVAESKDYAKNCRIFVNNFDGIDVTLYVDPYRSETCGWTAMRDGQELWIYRREVWVGDRPCDRCHTKSVGEYCTELHTYSNFRVGIGKVLRVCLDCYKEMGREGLLLDPALESRIKKWASKVVASPITISDSNTSYSHGTNND